MISYKYATVPIVHATGGLADTVVDVNDDGAGFVIKKYSSADLSEAIDRSAALFKKKNEWQKLLKKITQYNFSWEAAAKKYVEMYKRAIAHSA
jgi:starch synthase